MNTKDQKDSFLIGRCKFCKGRSIPARAVKSWGHLWQVSSSRGRSLNRINKLPRGLKYYQGKTTLLGSFNFRTERSTQAGEGLLWQRSVKSGIRKSFLPGVKSTCAPQQHQPIVMRHLSGAFFIPQGIAVWKLIIQHTCVLSWDGRVEWSGLA